MQDVLVKRGNHYMVDFRQFHETVPVSGGLLGAACPICCSLVMAWPSQVLHACHHARYARPHAGLACACLAKGWCRA